jgi:hypothetical protein
MIHQDLEFLNGSGHPASSESTFGSISASPSPSHSGDLSDALGAMRTDADS